MRSPSRISLLFCATALTCLGSLVARAAAPGTGPRSVTAPSKNAVSATLPVTLEAEHMDYDHEQGVVTAEGKVEITQGDTILLANKVSYNQNRNEVHASGNVSVLEPSGNVYFAEEATLKDDLQQGIIHEFRVRMSDQSLFAAREARRLNDHQTQLLKAVYSPCSTRCEDGSPKRPLWQIRAQDVLIDTEAEKVRYHNAYFDLYGVPVLYTPYLSHATPGAENKSGLMAPEYRHSSNLGSVYVTPVYLALSPSYDAMLTPIFTSNEGLVMAGEYRQLFDTGSMSLRGSITHPRDRDPFGNPTYGHTWRGHIFGEGRFTLNDDWNWGFDVNRTSDDTYLRRYEFSNETLLTSRLFTQGFNMVHSGRSSYASIEALSFQGLTASDDLKHTPFVAPLAYFEYESDPLAYGSRLTLSGNLLSLMRQEGADSRRASATARWAAPYISEGGHIFELATELRTDIYSVANVLQPNGTLYDGETGRIVPQASLGWRYPLIRRFETASVILEPQATFTVSPRGSNSSKIPNEDSAAPEFSDLNLFSTDRFPGYDRVETGPRVNYGLRSQVDFGDDRYASWVVGQDYRMVNDPLFPLTNDLRSHFSDYISRLSVHIAPLDVNYQVRLDKDGLTPNRQEVDAMLSFKRFSLNAAYLDLNDDPVLGSRREVYGSTAIQLTKEWAISLGARHNLQQSSVINGGVGLVYQNECITVTTAANRDLTTDRDVRPSTSFRIQVGFKNLQ